MRDTLLAICERDGRVECKEIYGDFELDGVLIEGITAWICPQCRLPVVLPHSSTLRIAEAKKIKG